MFVVRYWFGSPFAGQVCDDGPSGVLGEPCGIDGAKRRLKEFCNRQRCQVEMSKDGTGADFCNWNGSLTGGVQVRRTTNH